MKISLILTLTIFLNVAFGQKTIKTKEVKVNYSNAHEVFKVCVSGCPESFDLNKDYYWYSNEFSKIKSTKGSTGGNLLHGTYKLFDDQGNLRREQNYSFGIPDGVQKEWDSLGNITVHSRYKKGNLIYKKFKDEDNYWIEWIGTPLRLGSIKKVYNQYGQIVSEEKWLNELKRSFITYYENSGKIKQIFYKKRMFSDIIIGNYTSFYENGNVNTKGQFYDNEYSTIRVGAWFWYYSDGTLESTAKYKVSVENWSNGNVKSIGGLIFDSLENKWISTGEWKWFDEKGMIVDKKIYKLGEVVKE